MEKTLATAEVCLRLMHAVHQHHVAPAHQHLLRTLKSALDATPPPFFRPHSRNSKGGQAERSEWAGQDCEEGDGQDWEEGQLRPPLATRTCVDTVSAATMCGVDHTDTRPEGGEDKIPAVRRFGDKGGGAVGGTVAQTRGVSVDAELVSEPASKESWSLWLWGKAKERGEHSVPHEPLQEAAEDLSEMQAQDEDEDGGREGGRGQEEDEDEDEDEDEENEHEKDTIAVGWRNRDLAVDGHARSPCLSVRRLASIGEVDDMCEGAEAPSPATHDSVATSELEATEGDVSAQTSPVNHLPRVLQHVRVLDADEHVTEHADQECQEAGLMQQSASLTDVHTPAAAVGVNHGKDRGENGPPPAAGMEGWMCQWEDMLEARAHAAPHEHAHEHKSKQISPHSIHSSVSSPSSLTRQLAPRNRFVRSDSDSPSDSGLVCTCWGGAQASWCPGEWAMHTRAS